MLNVISVACILFVIWRLYFPDSLKLPNPTGLVGKELKLDDLSWSDSPKTVVLVLSTSCRYCKMSAGFYRALIDSAQPARYRVVAVLKEQAEEARGHLVELGLDRAGAVRQSSLDKMGVRFTPSLMVVDRHGKVEKAWVGFLNSGAQAEVFRAVQTAMPAQLRSPDVPVESVPVDRLPRLLRDPNVVRLDVRERSRFYEAHIPGFLNMPLDEIMVRAPHEIPENKQILVYCVDYHQGPCTDKQGFVRSACESASKRLSSAGFTNLLSIEDDLGQISGAGVAVDGIPCRPGHTQ